MHIVQTVHSASSVVRAVKSELLDGRVVLYVGYILRLEAFALTETGIERIARLTLNARLSDIQPLADGRVLVTTDAPDAYALVVCLEGDQLVVIENVSLSVGPHARPSEHNVRTTVTGTRAFSWHYSSRIWAIDFAADTGVDANEHPTVCLRRCEADAGPVLAILHNDSDDRRVIVTRVWKTSENDFSHATSHVSTTLACRSTHTLVPLPQQQALLTLGGPSVRIFKVNAAAPASFSPVRKKQRKTKERPEPTVDHQSEETSIIWDWGEVTSYDVVEATERWARVLVGDQYGRLILITVTAKDSTFTMKKVLLGQTSPSTSLSYLDNGVVFVGAHLGDSMLVKLLTAPSGLNGSYIQTIEQFSNIGPILDAVLVEDISSNQKQIVTCSGSNSSSSLRVVQKSAELEHLGTISATDAFSHCRRVIPLRVSWNSRVHGSVLVSSARETWFANFADGQVNIVASGDHGFVTDEPTLAAGNLKADTHNDLVIQITPTRIVVISLAKPRVMVAHRDSNDLGSVELDVASVSATLFMAARRDGVIFYGTFTGNINLTWLTPETLKSRLDRLNEPFPPPAEYGAPRARPVLALATDNFRAAKPTTTEFVVGRLDSVELFDIKKSYHDGLQLPDATLRVPSQVQSVVWTDFGCGRGNGHLVVGCIDGTVVIQRFKDAYEEFEGGPRTIGLGNQPVLVVKDGNRVLACGSGAAVLYWGDKRLQVSTIGIKDVFAAVPLNAPGYEDSTIFVSHSGLHFARISKLQRMHIRTINMGYDCPVRIAHNPSGGAYAVGCLKVVPVRVGEALKYESIFKVVKQDSFDTIREFSDFEANEDIQSVACLPILPVRPYHSASGKEFRDAYVVGTACIVTGEDESTRGRIIVYETVEGEDGFNSWIALTHTVPGSAYALASVDGLLIVAVNTALQFYALEFNALSETERAPRLSMRLVKEWNHNHVVKTLNVLDHLICVGDVMTSVTILSWRDGVLQQMSKYFSPLWPAAAAFIKPTTVIAADIDLNLFTFRQRQDDSRMLEKDGRFHLGEHVNKFIPGQLVSYGRTSSSGEAAFVPRHVFVTSTGCIGTVTQADDDASRKLYALQRNLARVLDKKVPGHEAWRAPHTSDLPSGPASENQTATGFLDGDLLERFFDLEEDSADYAAVMAGSNEAERLADAEGLKALLSELQALQG
ncbi:CPSF A subunit region-domain-containing protein [Auriculariales sp. MPI-PUGE-AT-0066]|nr:CPSF A subunit region-domain-containing protein [Auriculariales sp. MPI-PUGE-AT-0066]